MLDKAVGILIKPNQLEIVINNLAVEDEDRMTFVSGIKKG
jgi:hypothetical protein